MTQQEALQKATDYCTEKAYGETLTSEFMEKFSDFFAKKCPDAAADDEAAIADLKFNLDTAFSATSKGVTSKQKAFDDKEKVYKKQIEELQKKLGGKQEPPQIPDEIKEQIAELKKFKDEEAKKAKFVNIVSIAKKSIREDLHNSFEKYARTFSVQGDKSDEEQAKTLFQNFQDIYVDSLGDIRPRTPKQVQQQDDEEINNVPKVEL